MARMVAHDASHSNAILDRHWRIPIDSYVCGGVPGTLHLTNDMISQILEEEDIAMMKGMMRASTIYRLQEIRNLMPEV